MSRATLPPLEDDFARALLGSAETDAPSHAAYAKAAGALGLGVGLSVGASLSAAPAAVAVGAAGVAGIARWSSLLGAKLALLGVSGVLFAGAGVLLLRSSGPANGAPQPKPAPTLQAASKAVAHAVPAPVNASPERERPSAVSRAPEPVPHAVAPKSAPKSEPAAPAVGRPLAAESPAAAPAARRAGHGSPPAPPPPARVSSDSSLAEQVQSLDRARVALGSGDSASALREIARYRAAWPDGVFLTEASVLEIEALAARGERSQAAARAAAFVAAHPDSPQADRLRALPR